MNKKSIDCSNDTAIITPWRLLYIFVMTLICLMYCYASSIQMYGQQRYHIDLENYTMVYFAQRSLENPDNDTLLTNKSEKIIDPIIDQTDRTIDSRTKAKKIEQTPLNDADDILTSIISQKRDNASPQIGKGIKHQESTIVQQYPFDLSKKNEKIILDKKDNVFFAGDSLMQGVAPYAKKALFKKFNIESLDLSKQNTGLIYPKAFNWPKTIDEVLSHNNKIKLLVIFLGPNDPWNLRPNGSNRSLKFKSNEWEKHYRQRIENILLSAKLYNVKVLWLAVPCMRNRKLNNDMVYLNSLYQSEVEKANQYFLQTNSLLGCTYDNFVDYIEKDNAKIKMRIDDGIHFTIAAQRILANAIIEKLMIK